MAKSRGALPDMMGPLNVPAQKGDKLVPENDMAEVASPLNSGGEFPDPCNYIGDIE